MNVPPEITEALTRVVRGVADEAEQRRVAAWREASDANDEEFRELVVLSSVADETFPRYPGSPPAVTDLIATAEARATATPPHTSAVRARRGGWMIGAAAAAVILIFGLGVFGRSFFMPGPTLASADPVEFRTATGEQRTVKLEDGTLAHLAPSTTLRIYDDGGAPRMWLEGRAFFGVPHQEEGQIVIETSAGRVTIVGTRFDLRSLNGDLQLMVVDGEVSVSAGTEEAGVRSGELGLVNSGDLEAVVRVEDPFEYLSWMESAMVFQDTPFSRAAEELAARFDLTIDIQDPSVMDRTITTSFSERDLEEVLVVMCGVVHASCVLEGQTVTVTSM